MASSATDRAQRRRHEDHRVVMGDTTENFQSWRVGRLLRAMSVPQIAISYRRRAPHCDQVRRLSHPRARRMPNSRRTLLNWSTHHTGKTAIAASRTRHAAKCPMATWTTRCPPSTLPFIESSSGVCWDDTSTADSEIGLIVGAAAAGPPVASQDHQALGSACKSRAGTCPPSGHTPRLNVLVQRGLRKQV